MSGGTQGGPGRPPHQGAATPTAGGHGDPPSKLRPILEGVAPSPPAVGAGAAAPTAGGHGDPPSKPRPNPEGVAPSPMALGAGAAAPTAGGHGDPPSKPRPILEGGAPSPPAVGAGAATPTAGGHGDPPSKPRPILEGGAPSPPALGAGAATPTAGGHGDPPSKPRPILEGGAPSPSVVDLRCRFSVDDSIWFLRDIARRAQHSIFENGYLAFWRGLHETYGLKVQFNVYLKDGDTGFTLREMPDRFADQWRANADWLRLTFHARADKPDWPYAKASYDEVARDMREVTEQILRFAGPDTLSALTTLHWGTATVEGCRALRDQGIRALVGYFELHGGEPFVAYYLDRDTTAYLNAHDTWLDEREGILFVKHDLVLNLYPLAEIVPRLDAIYAKPDEREVLELMIHEQYFYPRWPAYQRDACEKVRRAAEWVAAHGYRWAFYEEWGGE